MSCKCQKESYFCKTSFECFVNVLERLDKIEFPRRSATKLDMCKISVRDWGKW